MSSKKPKSMKASEKSSKKPSKKKSKHSELITPDAWINELAETNINNDEWKCSVAIIEEETIEASIYLDNFNEYGGKSDRLAVKALTKLDVIQFVVKNMVGSAPGKEITPLALLCSEVFSICGPTFEKDIPTPLLGCVIKYIILGFKAANKNIRNGLVEKKKDFDNYQESLLNTLKSGKPESSKATTSTKTKTQSEKSVKTPKVVSKPFTKLRKRGEEWKDVSWVEDAPDRGPQLYVAVSKFYNADLPLEFINLKIPLHAIIKVSFSKTQSFSKRSQSVTLSSKTQESSVYSKSATIRSSARQKILASKILKFWNMTYFLKNELPTSVMFENIMFLQFVPDYSKLSFELGFSGKEIYNQITYFLYDTFEIAELHKKYTHEIKCMDVLEQNKVVDVAELEMYNFLLDNTPPEVLMVPFLLDCMVDQACEFNEVSSEQETSKDVSMDKPLSADSTLTGSQSFIKLLEDLNFKYDLVENTDEQDENLFAYSTVTKCSIKNILKFFDNIDIKTFHLENEIQQLSRNRTKSALLVAWCDQIEQLIQNVPVPEETVKKCNQMVKHFGCTGDMGLYFYMYLIILNHMLSLYFPSSEIEHTCLVPEHQSIHYDKEDLCEKCLLEIKGICITGHCHPSTSIKTTCSDCRYPSVQCNKDDLCDECLLEVKSILNTSRRSTSLSCKSELMCTNLDQDDLFPGNEFFIEYLSPKVMVQKIQAEAQNFNKIEARRCSQTNQIVVVFHNLLPEGVWLNEEKTRGVIRTLVPIRDFVEYILEEESTWLESIESLSEASAELQQTVSLSIHNFGTKQDYNLLFPDHQFLSFRSLKYATLQKQLQLEKSTALKSSKQPKAEKPATNKTKSSSNKSDKPNKKVKDPMKTGLSDKKEFFKGFLQQAERKSFAFIGYDLEGPIRFQFDGHRTDKLLPDDCRVTLNTVKKLYGTPVNSLILTMCNHSLYYSHTTSKELPINPFHFISSSGLILSFSPALSPTNTSEVMTTNVNNQVLGKESQPSFNRVGEISSFSQLKEGEGKKFGFLSSTVVETHLYEIPFSYDLQLSLPSGLHCEIAHTSQLFYIRQQFLSKGPLAKSVINEKCRCFLIDGRLVKYMMDGTIQILSPNGALCTVFEIEDNAGSFEINQLPTGFKEELGKDESGSLPDETKTKKKPGSGPNYTTEKEPTFDHEGLNLNLLTNENKNSSTLNFIKYSQTTSEGKRFVTTYSKIEVMQELLIISTNDVANDCINCERLDGVKTKHKSDGSLITHFPDGSRITSIPFETEEIFCEWESEEFEKWFGNSSSFGLMNQSLPKVSNFPSRLTFKNTEKNSRNSNSLRKSELEHETERKVTDGADSNASNVSNKNSIPSNVSSQVLYQDGLIDDNKESSHNTFHKLDYLEDGFVFFNVQYLMEHPNYLSVEVNESCCEVNLTLPFDTKISLRKNGSYKTTLDGVTLTVDKGKVYFCRTNNTGEVIRSMILNTSPKDGEAKENSFGAEQHRESFPSHFENLGTTPIIEEITMDTEMKDSVLLYVVDGIGNKMIVDKKLNIKKHQTPVPKEVDKNHLIGANVSCYVLNPDLSGFILVTQEEVDTYSANVGKNGLVENNGTTVFTSMPIVQNESEKWLVKYKEDVFDEDPKVIYPSTYGQKEAWFQPFVERTSVVKELNEYEAVTVRLLHKISINRNVLKELNVPLDMFTSISTNKIPIPIVAILEKCDINIEEIIANPSILCKMIDDEIEKRNKVNDTSRLNVERQFLHSLVNKAVISARKTRRKNVENNLKKALKNKSIPPYHSSCFGQVHGILDEVLEHVGDIRKSTSSTFTFDRVNTILDELLSLVCRSNTLQNKSETENDVYEKEIESLGMKSIISDIFKNVCEITRVRSEQVIINSILDKPITCVSSNDIETICNAINFNPCNCPFLDREDFILKDVLDARVQLSHYFDTLRKMLEFYRNRFDGGFSQTLIS